MTYLAGNQLYGLPGASSSDTLEAPMNTLLIALLAPAAVPAPDGADSLAYNSWGGKRPVIRLYDARGNEDVVLVDGAYSLAWRRDGALAYFKGRPRVVDPRAPKRYVGHVLVRASLDAHAVRWTSDPGRYVVAGWAGRSLLAYRLGSGWPDLLVLDGPGHTRALAKTSGLVAVNPEGRRAFVVRYGVEPPVVAVLDIVSGEETARLRLDEGPLTRELRFVTETGSWAGDAVAAAVTGGIAVFRVQRDSIVLEQVVRFDPAGFPLGVFEPQLAPSGRRFFGWTQRAQQPRQPVPETILLDCDRFTLRCRRSEPLSAAVGPRLVYNPSRP